MRAGMLFGFAMALLLAGCTLEEPAPPAPSETSSESGGGEREGAADGPASEPGQAPETETDPPAEVAIVDFSFSPDNVTIARGGTVAWTNQDQVAHTVTADDGGFDSGALQQGEGFVQRFDEPGTYEYHCRFHPGMRGQVEVV